jgi:PAS domain S-box-containing protein
MNSINPLKPTPQPSPSEVPTQTELRIEGGMEKKNQGASVPGHDTRIERAEWRTKEANTRTDQAEARTKQANIRTDQANSRTEQAEMRTEQAEARSGKAIRASELRYRRLFETAPDGILILDAVTGQVVDANPFMKDLLGYSQEEFLGRKLWEIGPFKGEDASKITFAQLQQADRIRYEGLPLETKDGRRVEVEFISSAYLVDQKRFIQCNLRGITERKQLERQLIEAQKMQVIGQLAGGVAHDFNNILAVIMGYCDLTLKEPGLEKETRSHLEAIRLAAERAAGLTRQLLIFSRKQTVQPTVLDLNDVLKDLNKMLRRLINENIEMTIVPGAQIGRVKADSGYVGQVLMNLVVNARDAMPNGGKLTITTNNVTLDQTYARAHPDAVAGDYIMLSVSDTGTGMSDETKAHLFEAFFTTKPKGKGTGLGLSTCQTIVQQSGGCIGFYTELGKGTTFQVYFPRVEQALEAPDVSILTGPSPRGTETLLLVEDDPSVRHLACAVLEGQGYRVLRAGDGQEGLRVTREPKGLPIDLVITDVIMPVMGGKAMVEWLKVNYPDLKVLFTSGYTEDAMMQQDVLKPGVAFLPKPYTPGVLLRKVRELLDAAPPTTPLLKQPDVAGNCLRQNHRRSMASFGNRPLRGAFSEAAGSDLAQRGRKS